MNEQILKNKNLNKGLKDEIATRKRSLDFYSLGMTLPDPDPVLKKQGKDMKVYKELLCDPHVFACIQSRKAGVLSLEWQLKKEKETDKNADIVENLLKELDIYDLISDIVNAPLFGYQPLEIIWQKQDGLILPVQIKAKPPEWFCFDDDNKLRFKTKENYEGEELPDKKFLCPQSNPSYENPYGERVLSRVFWSVVFKKGGVKFWVIFTEKYGMPFLIGKHPRGTSKEDNSDLAQLLEAMIQDAIAVIPDDSSVEIQEGAKGSSAEIYEKLIDKMNAEASKAILGQTLTTEIGSTGSYAASNTHFAVRKDIIDSDKKLAEKTINQLIKWIYELNWNTAEIPIFELYEEEDVDLTLSQRDKTLVDSGVKFTKEYFIKTYGFEEKDLEVESVTKIKPQDKSFKQFVEANIDGQAEIDDLVDIFNPESLNKKSEVLLNPIQSLFNDCESYEELTAKLAKAELNTQEFEDELSKALFLAEVWGRVDAEYE